MNSRIQGFKQALETAGVPVSLAQQCAQIIAKDDNSFPNLGRTQEEKHLIQSAYFWMQAKGFFE